MLHNGFAQKEKEKQVQKKTCFQKKEKRQKSSLGRNKNILFKKRMVGTEIATI